MSQKCGFFGENIEHLPPQHRVAPTKSREEFEERIPRKRLGFAAEREFVRHARCAILTCAPEYALFHGCHGENGL